MSNEAKIRYEAKIRNWMRNNLTGYVDDCGEVNATALVEGWDFSEGSGEETLDMEHPAWDIAASLAEWYEKNRK